MLQLYPGTDKYNIKFIIHYYSKDINKLLESCWFKNYRRSVSASENLKYPEILLLIYEESLIEIFSPNLTKIWNFTWHQHYLAKGKFSRLSIIKQKFWSAMLKERLNYMFFLSLQKIILQYYFNKKRRL